MPRRRHVYRSGTGVGVVIADDPLGDLFARPEPDRFDVVAQERDGIPEAAIPLLEHLLRDERSIGRLSARECKRRRRRVVVGVASRRGNRDCRPGLFGSHVIGRLDRGCIPLRLDEAPALGCFRSVASDDTVVPPPRWPKVASFR